MAYLSQSEAISPKTGANAANTRRDRDNRRKMIRLLIPLRRPTRLTGSQGRVASLDLVSCHRRGLFGILCRGFRPYADASNGNVPRTSTTQMTSRSIARLSAFVTVAVALSG